MNNLTDEDAKELITDVVFCCQQDAGFLEAIVDDYIYKCSNEELEDLVDDVCVIFGDDT
tara:strand:- start:3048 stop:3224 length:177 start_codon:yes stop_codon:yes gene_type:complete